MKIYYEDNHVIVVEKKANQPTQEDSSGDFDLLSEVREYIRVTYNKPGNVYVGLVHRLDRPVGGVMVFAKTSKAASRLSDQVRTRTLDKRYCAMVMGKIERQKLTDILYKDRKTNTSYVVKANHPEGKKASLEILETRYFKDKDISYVDVDLHTGRSHQIRVQLSHAGHPIWGDARYNRTAQAGEQIALWAHSLSFDHPTTKKRMTFTSHTPDRYPFTLL